MHFKLFQVNSISGQTTVVKTGPKKPALAVGSFIGAPNPQSAGINITPPVEETVSAIFSDSFGES